jgi:hypothetical protein
MHCASSSVQLEYRVLLCTAGLLLQLVRMLLVHCSSCLSIGQNSAATSWAGGTQVRLCPVMLFSLIQQLHH